MPLEPMITNPFHPNSGKLDNGNPALDDKKNNFIIQ